MEDSRRHFLKIAGLFGLGLTAKPVLDAFAAGGGEPQAVTQRFAEPETIQRPVRPPRPALSGLHG